MEAKNDRNLVCYKLLSDVLIDGAYSSIRLNKELGDIDSLSRAYISRLFYGVLEKSVQFDYLISVLTSKKPKPKIVLFLKMGLYMLRYMDIPSYAAINTVVDLTKKVGKSGVSGFVNAVLRKSMELSLPSKNEIEQSLYLSVIHSVPRWICEKMICQYGYDFSEKFFESDIDQRTHIRNNSRLINKHDFEQMLSGNYTSTDLGYYVSHDAIEKMDSHIYTSQSLASMIATTCYLPNDIENPKIIDLCGAPGGKSIYLEELTGQSEIICCDMHPHRVDLISNYARRMKSNIKYMLSDATVKNDQWSELFDIVICDAPCSGMGDCKSKPDVMFNRNSEDILKLQSTQMKILENAKNYVKIGGYLCYSTCSVFKEENDDVVNRFLRSNPQFMLDIISTPYAKTEDGMIRLFPHINNCDGFFVARMRRVL